MEIGAVIAAVPAAHVVRPGSGSGRCGHPHRRPYRTGRIGGATGSSKAHDASSLLTCGAEVQKGNRY
jgi:phosphoribosylformylglycinamidine synthase